MDLIGIGRADLCQKVKNLKEDRQEVLPVSNSSLASSLIACQGLSTELGTCGLFYGGRSYHVKRRFKCKNNRHVSSQAYLIINLVKIHLIYTNCLFKNI